MDPEATRTNQTLDSAGGLISVPLAEVSSTTLFSSFRQGTKNEPWILFPAICVALIGCGIKSRQQQNRILQIRRSFSLQGRPIKLSCGQLLPISKYARVHGYGSTSVILCDYKLPKFYSEIGVMPGHDSHTLMYDSCRSAAHPWNNQDSDQIDDLCLSFILFSSDSAFRISLRFKSVHDATLYPFFPRDLYLAESHHCTSTPSRTYILQKNVYAITS